MEEENQETKYRKDTIEEQNLIIDKAIQLRSKYREQLKVKQHQWNRLHEKLYKITIT